MVFKMEKDLSQIVIDAAMEVHQLLGGPGLMESIYESALCHELLLRGIKSRRQIPIPVIYKSAEVRDPLYLDILVEDKLIIEVKATGKDFPFYQAQLLTYMRLMGKEKGLLINFGKPNLREGICHLVNCPECLTC